MTYAIEFIPNEDLLYYRIHQVHIQEGEVTPAAFTPHNGGMSTDWSKYSTPKESLKRARSPRKNGIVHFVTVNLRNLKLEVVHSPSRKNQAHSEVKHVQSVEIRLKLLDLFNWEIFPKLLKQK